LETNEVLLAVESGDSIGDESWIVIWLAQDDEELTNIADDGFVSVVELEPHDVLVVINPLLPKIKLR